MGSAAESTAVTHLTSVSGGAASARPVRLEPKPPPRPLPHARERARRSARAWRRGGGRSGADASLESSGAKPGAPCGPGTGGCAFLSQPSQVPAAPRSLSEPASRPWRGRRRLWTQLRAARRGAAGGCGEGGLPSLRAASQLESGGPGSREEERGPRDGARLGHSGLAAPVPSLFRPFWVTSTPLYRPHLSGAASTAPWGRGRGGDTARARIGPPRLP